MTFYPLCNISHCFVPVRRRFDPICYSHEQGVAKPDAGAYLTALERMGARAEDVLFIDDNDAPARGAESCGIRAVPHRDNATTIAAIERFLAN
ncbi:HAD-IA family hydrolase [Microbacterium aurugineum]|uniref:HAD-IA family hydrolase n=1 Tax=Microbacterium aurugineum TaxID=2851642 RepID=A0ABY4J3H8_9MICO|nr:HAD-IA family hydrolase [Microbacterium aurugineum]